MSGGDGPDTIGQFRLKSVWKTTGLHQKVTWQSMKISLILFILLSAVLHMYWNVLVKKSNERLCFLWWMYLVSFLLLPFVVLFMQSNGIPPMAWLVVFVSGVIHLIYTVTLSYAYKNGDLSLVYPLARSAPLFVAIGALIFLKEIPSIVGFTGIIFTVVGAYVIGLESLTIRHMIKPVEMLKSRPYQLALLVAVISASYTIVDRVGVSFFDPFTFIVLLLFIEAILFTPFILWKKKKFILPEWRDNKINILVAGTTRFLSYFLILYVMLQAQLGYIVAVRQISIILAVITGSMMLQEAHFKTRLIGSMGILTGVVLIGAKG
jgi:drug/metabolite transporter (DMT)-like permease